MRENQKTSVSLLIVAASSAVLLYGNMKLIRETDRLKKKVDMLLKLNNFHYPEAIR